MNSLIFILTMLVATAQSQSEEPDVEQCLAESAINKDDRTVYKIDDPIVGCVQACIMKKIGVMKNGKINAEKIFETQKQYRRVNLETFRVQIDMCTSIANEQTDECRVPIFMRECMIKRSKEVEE